MMFLGVNILYVKYSSSNLAFYHSSLCCALCLWSSQVKLTQIGLELGKNVLDFY